MHPTAYAVRHGRVIFLWVTANMGLPQMALRYREDLAAPGIARLWNLSI
jgi:hypothetical protein